jgi:hypothetical protein
VAQVGPEPPVPLDVLVLALVDVPLDVLVLVLALVDAPPDVLVLALVDAPPPPLDDEVDRELCPPEPVGSPPPLPLPQDQTAAARREASAAWERGRAGDMASS